MQVLKDPSILTLPTDRFDAHIPINLVEQTISQRDLLAIFDKGLYDHRWLV